MAIKFSGEEKNKAICQNIDEVLLSYLNRTNVKSICFKGANPMTYLFVGKIDSSKQNIVFTQGPLSNTKNLFICRKNQKLALVTELPDYMVRRDGIIKEDLFNLLDIEVVGYELSGKVFGRKEDKEKLVGSVIKAGDYYIDYGNSKKLDEETYYVGIPFIGQDEDGNPIKKHIKFVVSEINFRIPNLTGYSIPKDRTIKVNDKVNLVYDKLGEPWTVLEIIKDKTSKKVSKNSRNRMKDIVTIIKNGITKKVFVKHLKKI